MNWRFNRNCHINRHQNNDHLHIFSFIGESMRMKIEWRSWVLRFHLNVNIIYISGQYFRFRIFFWHIYLAVWHKGRRSSENTPNFWSPKTLLGMNLLVWNLYCFSEIFVVFFITRQLLEQNIGNVFISVPIELGVIHLILMLVEFSSRAHIYSRAFIQRYRCLIAKD